MAFGNRYATAALLAALSLALIALAGCSSSGATSEGAPANTVTASGSGTAQAAPDTAEMSFGVTTMSADAKSALDDAAKIAGQITSAVKKQGIADEDIQTRDVSVYPQTTDQNGKQVITGYQASLSVQVKVRDIAKLGEVISAANDAGANTISGPSFTIADPAPVRAEAIDEAVADARTSAEAMAQGRRQERRRGAEPELERRRYGRPDVQVSRHRRGGQGAVPIEPGQLDITATVVVVFELK